MAGDLRMRQRLDGADLAELPLLKEFRAKGGTEYFALQSRFGGAHVVGPVDRILTSWVSDAPDGFSESDIAALEEIAPVLAFAAKNASTHRITETMLETYLGRDAGKRVLDGNVQRGQGDSIRAALWSCDLQGFTKLADRLSREELMALMDDYFDAMVTTLHDAGGQVLKFIGDGLLAIFSLGSDAECCAASLTAAEKALRRVDALTLQRQSTGLPISRFYIALHLGEVMYGNIGAQNRLDFTVVGPAVNEVARIESMCRSLDQSLVISQAFARGRLRSGEPPGLTRPLRPPGCLPTTGALHTGFDGTNNLSVSCPSHRFHGGCRFALNVARCQCFRGVVLWRSSASLSCLPDAPHCPSQDAWRARLATETSE